MMIDAILPAGGRIRGDFADEAGVEIKALALVNGSTLLERAVGAVAGTGRIRRSVIIGPPEVTKRAAAMGVYAALPEVATGPDNIMLGLERLQSGEDGPPPDRVLVVTTDLPFVTPGALTAFVDLCPTDMAICLPAIRREEFEARFPGSVNQFVSLRDGEWTIGGVFLLDPEVLCACKPHIDRVFRARKSQAAMALLLGLPLIARYLTGRLAIRHIEARCSAILGCTGAAVLGCPPELAFDIDMPADYQYAVSYAPPEAADAR